MAETEEIREEGQKSGKMNAILQRVKRLRVPITVEPLIFLYTVSVGLNEVIRSNLIITKICQSKLNYNDTICEDLNAEANEHIQDIVQENVTEYETIYSSVAFVPRILYGLLAGTWSDRNGRKILIGLPILGQFLASVSYGLNYLFLTRLPWQMLFLEFVNELTGTYVAYYLAIYSYITDVSAEESRTIRLSVADGMDYFSTSIGTLVSGPLFLAAGYYGVFGCSAGSSLLSLLYLIFFVKESLKRTGDISTDSTSLREGGSNKNYGSQGELQAEPVEPQTKSFMITSFLYIFESLRTVFRARRWPKKSILFLAIFNFAAFIFIYNGTEGTHRYLYAQKKYKWNEQDFTRYLFNYRIAYMVALWIVSPILSSVLKVPDPLITILACCASIVGFVLPAVQSNSSWFTVGSFICMFSPLTTVTTRAVLSKVVDGDEIGRIYSVLALFSAASGSLVEAAFQSLYSATLSSFLGAYLLVLAGLCGITIPVSLTILLLTRKLNS